MDILLVVLGLFLMLAGIAGSFLPVIPGPPLSWIGLLLLSLTSAVPLNWWFLGSTLGIALGVVGLDYVIPAMGTKKFWRDKGRRNRLYYWFISSFYISCFRNLWNYCLAFCRCHGRRINKQSRQKNSCQSGLWILYWISHGYLLKIYDSYYFPRIISFQGLGIQKFFISVPILIKSYNQTVFSSIDPLSIGGIGELYFPT